MASPVRSVPAVLLVALVTAFATTQAVGQVYEERTLDPAGLVHVGTWNGATGQRMGDPPVAALGGGPAPVLVYDNSNVRNPLQVVPYVVMLLDYGVLSAEGNNSITRITIGYASCAATTDITLRLHRGVNAGEAANPKELPGKGLSIPLFGLPGDDVDCNADPPLPLLGRLVDVLLPYPIPLDDGAIRYGLQLFDNDTYFLRAKENPALQINNALQAYNTNDGSAYQPPFDGADPSIFIQLWGTAPAFDPLQGNDRDLGGRDSHEGAITPAGDVDTFRYEALAGEQLSVSVSGKGKDGLAPAVELVDLTTGLTVAQVADGSTGAMLKKVELPSSGAYELRVAGFDEEAAGVYRMKVRAKASPLAKQVNVPEAPGSVLATFVAKPGTLVNALVKPTVKTDASVSLPLLEGPIGPIDLSPWATLKGANTWRIKNAPLPLFGTYQLVQASEEGEGGVDQFAKLRIKPPRVKASRSDELGDALEGAWIQREFVTNETSFRMSLGTLEGGDRFERVEGQNSVVSKTITPITNWNVQPEGLVGLPDALSFAYKIAATKQLIKPFSEGGLNDVENVSSGGQQAFKDVFQFKDGNPNVIEFPFFDVSQNGDKLWYREVSTTLTPPVFSVGQVPTVGDGGGGAVVLSIECQDDVSGYEVYKTPVGDTIPPSFPFARIQPECIAGETDLAQWIDTGSVLDPAGSAYWIVAVGPDGRRSVLSGPTSLD